MALSTLVGCAFNKVHAPPTPGSSQLKSFKDPNFTLFLALTPYSGEYEFITCDRASVDAAATKVCTDDQNCRDITSQKPPYCVSSFVSSPLESYCAEYPSIKLTCANLEQKRAHCALPPEQRSELVHENICASLDILDISCPISIARMQRSCEPLVAANTQCSNTSLDLEARTASCNEMGTLAANRRSYMLYNKDWGPIERYGLQLQLDFEKFLAIHNSPEHRRWQFFGTGSALGALGPRMVTHISRLLPNTAALKTRTLAAFGKQIPLNTKKLIGISTTFAAGTFPPLSDAFIPIYNYFGYSLEGRCAQRSSGGNLYNTRPELIPPPLRLEDDAFGNTILEGAPYFTAGLSMSMIIGKITESAHPLVALGSLIITPFAVHQLVSRAPDGSGELKALMGNFDDLLAPESSAPPTEQVTNKVGDITKLLPILARSLIYAGQARLPEVERFCVPHKIAGIWQPRCRSIWEGVDTGNMRDLITDRGEIIVVDETMDCQKALTGVSSQESPTGEN